MIETKIKDGVKYYNIWGGWIREDRVQFIDDTVMVNLNPNYEFTIDKEN